jgi:hypothetical protein
MKGKMHNDSCAKGERLNNMTKAAEYVPKAVVAPGKQSHRRSAEVPGTGCGTGSATGNMSALMRLVVVHDCESSSAR